MPYQAWDDYAIYHGIAADLTEGRGVVRGWTEGASPSAFWPVGYSAFLVPFYALFGADVRVAQLVNVILRIVALLFTGLAARRLFGANVAKLAVIVLGFFPSLYFHTLSVGYNTLLLSLYASVAALALGWDRLHWGRSVVLALVVAVMVYVRPIFLLFPVLLPVLWRVERRAPLKSALIHSAAIASIVFLLLVPWLGRGFLLFGQWVPLYTNGGINLFIGNNPEATGGYYSAPAFALAPATAQMNEAERDGYYRTLALEWMAEHPVQVALNGVKKAALIFMRDDQAVSFATKIRYAERSPAMLLFFVLFANIYYGVVAALAVGYSVVAILRRQLPRSAALLWLMVGYVIAFYVLFFGMDHYKAPLLFILAILSALATRELAGTAQTVLPVYEPAESTCQELTQTKSRST